MSKNKFYKHTVILEIVSANFKLTQADVLDMVEELRADAGTSTFLHGKLSSSKTISGPQAMRELRKMDYAPEEEGFDENGDDAEEPEVDLSGEE